VKLGLDFNHAFVPGFQRTGAGVLKFAEIVVEVLALLEQVTGLVAEGLQAFFNDFKIKHNIIGGVGLVVPLQIYSTTVWDKCKWKNAKKVHFLPFYTRKDKYCDRNHCCYSRDVDEEDIQV